MIEKADLVFVNGPVITMDPQNRICRAVAVAGNRILHAGEVEETKALAGPGAEIVDLKGRSLLPGFIDAHCHPGFYAGIKARIPMGGRVLKTLADIKAAVRERAAVTPAGDWVLGWGYNDTELEERRHPTCRDLDEAAPNHKVFLSRACGHVVAVNSRVLEQYGITENTPDPEGGRIGRDENGRLNGLLFENAKIHIENDILPNEADLTMGMKAMSRDFLGFGVTSAHDAGYWDPLGIRLYQRGVSEGWIKIRINFMPWFTDPDVLLGEHFIESGLMTGFGNDRLKIGPAKIIMDGSMGGRSAAVKEAYPGYPDNFGILCRSQEDLYQRILKAHLAGYQVGIHAIGDRAVASAIEGYERVLKEHPRSDHRHRIEHCSFLDEDMMDQMARLGLVAGFGQPFLYSMGDNYIEIFGQERLQGVYPLKTMIEKGIPTALTSDAPVTIPNPMHGIYFALTHKTIGGQTIAPHQAVDLMSALRAYTIVGAYAGFDEANRGSIEPGKLADLVVLSRDILNTPAEEILDIKADLTMVDGEVVFTRD